MGGSGPVAIGSDETELLSRRV